jgi:GTPase SAR1 family protein
MKEGAGRKVPVVLCGNKSDLRDGPAARRRSHVSAEDGAKLASLCGALFIETSPKTGTNVLDALVILARSEI